MFQPGVMLGLRIVENAVAVVRLVDPQERRAHGHDDFVVFAVGMKLKGDDIDGGRKGEWRRGGGRVEAEGEKEKYDGKKRTAHAGW